MYNSKIRLITGTLITSALFLYSEPTVQGSLVDADFSIGIAGTWASAANFGAQLPNGTGVAAADANITDLGWVGFVGSGGAQWDSSSGVAERTQNNKFAYSGLGQIISNPGAGFANGDVVNFGFDYRLGGTPNGFIGAVYGITAPNGTDAAWNIYGSTENESIFGFGQTAGSSVPTVLQTDHTNGADYQFYLLNNFSTQSVTEGFQTYSSEGITLTREYALFAVVFQGNPAEGGVVSLDNVSFTAVPEPSTYALLLGASTVGLLILRRRKAKD